MPKIWDELMSRATPDERTALQDVMVVDASNVGEYADQLLTQHLNDPVDMLKMFPNIAPPFDRMFFEFNYISKMVDVSPARVSWGVMLEAYKTEDLMKSVGDAKLRNIQGLAEKCVQTDVHMQNSKWVVAVITYPGRQMKGHSGEFERAFSCTLYPVDELGRMVEKSPGLAVSKVISGGTPDQSRSWEPMFNTLGWPALMTLCFMHCKNVVSEVREPSRTLKAFSKAKPYRYHVLKIEPMKKVIRSEAGSDVVGAAKALHIVRGHFRDYTEKGLFGKYKGMYFSPMHLRGQADRVVEKSYAVTAPKP